MPRDDVGQAAGGLRDRPIPGYALSRQKRMEQPVVTSRLYRERFAPSRRREQAETTVCVSAICAETDEEAQRLASSQRMAITLLRQGRLIAVPTVEKALTFLADAGIGEGAGGRRAVVGTPGVVRAGLEEVAAEYGADEVLVVTITHDHEARRRSYELIAGAFALERSAAA